MVKLVSLIMTAAPESRVMRDQNKYLILMLFLSSFWLYSKLYPGALEAPSQYTSDTEHITRAKYKLAEQFLLVPITGKIVIPEKTC